jgi:hypothetical protein
MKVRSEACTAVEILTLVFWVVAHNQCSLGDG